MVEGPLIRSSSNEPIERLNNQTYRNLCSLSHIYNIYIYYQKGSPAAGLKSEPLLGAPTCDGRICLVGQPDSERTQWADPTVTGCLVTPGILLVVVFVVSAMPLVLFVLFFLRKKHTTELDVSGPRSW